MRDKIDLQFLVEMRFLYLECFTFKQKNVISNVNNNNSGYFLIHMSMLPSPKFTTSLCDCVYVCHSHPLNGSDAENVKAPFDHVGRDLTEDQSVVINLCLHLAGAI